jgi:hypothetical protein
VVSQRPRVVGESACRSAKLLSRNRRQSSSELYQRSGLWGATPVAVIVARVNAVVAGWVNYFRVGNSFSEVRNYLEMKIRTLLTRRKRRRKTSIGWWRWSNAYVYGVLRRGFTCPTAPLNALPFSYKRDHREC